MVGLAGRKFRTQLREDVDLDFLYGCIGEKIKVITTVYFDNVFVPSVDYPIIFNPPPAFFNRVYSADIVFFGSSTFLNEAQVGDDFRVVGTTPTPYVLDFKMLEIIASNGMRADQTFAFVVENSLNSFAFNRTPMKSLIYQFGLGIGGFKSKTDNSLQKFIVNSDDKLSDVDVVLENLGNLDWQFDTVTSEGIGAGPYVTQQRLRITHETIVSPLFLATEYENLRQGIAPTYFKPDNKIRYSTQIDYNKNGYVINSAATLYPEDTGQFGWFNTRFDGGKSSYKINSLQFTRTDLTIANQLEYDEIEVKFIITSTTSLFDAVDTSMVFGFNYLPSEESFYRNTGRTMEENYCFDSVFFKPDNTPVNGEKFGTPNQVIKTVNAEILTTTTCEVTVAIKIESGNYPVLKQSDIAQYQIFCIVERIDTDPKLSDKTNLLVDVNYIYVQKTKIDLLDMDTVFIEHPYEDRLQGEETLEMFPVDDVVADSIIQLDYTGLENDGIIIKAVTPQIVLTHLTEADIVLDSRLISTENYPTIGTAPAVQDINFAFNRPYKIEDGIRKTVTINRDYLSDVGNVVAWKLSFPFMNRWEYWISLGLDLIPDSLFDSTKPFGGANNFWNRLANTSGWTLVYRTTFDIVQNGEDFEQIFEKELTSTDFNSNTDWSNCSIKSYDVDTNLQVIVGPKNYIYSQKETLIKASFQKTTGVVPDVSEVAMVIWLESFEGGGITDIRRISSVYDVISSSPFKGVEGLNTVKITKNINTFTGEALIDFSKLPTGQRVTLYARIYEIEGDPIPEGGRITNNNELRVTNNGYVRVVN